MRLIKKRLDASYMDDRVLKKGWERIWPNLDTKRMDKMVKTGFQPDEGRGPKKRKRK